MGYNSVADITGLSSFF